MILDEIVLKTKERYKEKLNDLENIKELSKRRVILNPNFFYEAIGKKGISFICEIKKASPSKGVISEDFPYLEIAKKYNECADCISCLTEPYFFLGSDEYLTNIKMNVNIPVLRKDFILYDYQIYEAKCIGADAILLIVAILDKTTLKKYIDLAHLIGLGCLVEAHSELELEIAISCGAKVVGVNNRNLKDFTIDMNNSINLRNKAPKNILFVSESGIKVRNDIKKLEENNVNAVLIGETLMRSNDIINEVRKLKND
ncbi:MAG: indole-3-glycerol phosphate synthase TrpC [Acholeplasmatales bacterium]|nr:indole-3-glycerol phosphate synthase TrpC [Acholeplasmatales bacterium]